MDFASVCGVGVVAVDYYGDVDVFEVKHYYVVDVVDIADEILRWHHNWSLVRDDQGSLVLLMLHVLLYSVVV